MKELQIHHIAKRLPYGLKFTAEDKEWQMTSINYIDPNYQIWANNYWNEESLKFYPEVNAKDYSIGSGFNINEIKPILFPLSCLTQEITVNEETFIPLIELAKKHFRHIYPKNYQTLSVNEIMVFDDVIRRRFKFENDTFLSTGVDEFMSPVYNQFELFEKLIEWHIDLPHENLIEKGLAISVLDLDKNPYA